MTICTQELRPDTCRGGLSSHPIYDITPFTMQDYPDKMACIIWFAGCNMRCGYCHNPEIIRSKGKYNLDALFTFLKKRQDMLDAVVLSGGEATLYPDIIKLAQKIKSMGYQIKLDTNGTRPDIIQNMIEKDLVDYIALDYKAPDYKYNALSKHKYFKHFHKSLAFLCQQNKTEFEIRTTVHTDLLDEQDILYIINDLETLDYKNPYYIQNYHITHEGRSLANMPEQKRKMDIDFLASQKTEFDLLFRNFT